MRNITPRNFKNYSRRFTRAACILNMKVMEHYVDCGNRALRIFHKKPKTYIVRAEGWAAPVVQVVVETAVANAKFEAIKEARVFQKIKGIEHIESQLKKSKGGNQLKLKAP